MSSFDWGDYHELAKELCNDKNGRILDAKQRSAVSRAYYAVFNLAIKNAVKNFDGFDEAYNELRNNAQVHELVIHWYESKDPNIG